MEALIKLFKFNMTKPELYGWFHIASLVITILLTILLLKQKTNETKMRKILGITAFIVILLEIYKQLYYGTKINENIIFNYYWYVFPWQFCSTPMYINLLASISKKQKLHYRYCCYLATYALLAGILVMLYPASVFTENVLINIQTMINHGTMVSIGFYLLLSGYVKCEKETLLEALKIFAICISIAIALNEWAYVNGILEKCNFNMFYISPYLESELPIYNTIQKIVPYPVDVILYISAFTCASYIILLATKHLTKSHD